RLCARLNENVESIVSVRGIRLPVAAAPEGPTSRLQSGALRPLRRKTSARIRRSRYADRLQARLDLRERSKIRP
ncbi:hypothetical protein, partial [Alistipes communis]|uniref:hypothetical protein n=1 Tax=Alistipes communis TaxID=2585118 RepID=UPI003FD84FFE